MPVGLVQYISNAVARCGPAVDTKMMFRRQPYGEVRGRDKRPATLYGRDVDAELARSDQDWDAVMRLAWRPAWSIRSRRGAWAAFADMIAGRGDPGG